jgi:cysteine desulfurase
MTIYFDHAATTATDPRVVAAMLPYFSERYGNPSELHALGREAQAAVAAARGQVAAALGAEEQEIIFTSGGTESDNLAILGFLQERGPGHVVSSAIEHPAVLEPLRFLERLGWAVTYVPVDDRGFIDREAYEAAFLPETKLVSIMMANNVVGTVQPVGELARIAHEHGVPFHSDAVQAVGSIPVHVDELGVDLLSLSAHKLYGPKGVGALYVRSGTRLRAHLHGGGQEGGLRSSTENVPGIVGLGLALTIATEEMAEQQPRLTALRDRLIDGVLAAVDDVILLGDRERRLPGNACFAVRFVEGESMVLQLDFKGIAASSGSACAASSPEPSHVLLALGLAAQDAQSSLRLTLGRENTEEEVNRFLTVFPGIVRKLRAMSPLAPKE